MINRYLPGDHALVLGASVAGMLAARALSDFFETVTVVERDQLPGNPESRRGVPQGRHAHLLWARGAEVLDQLFPGLSRDLVTDGAPVFDGEDLSQVYLHNGGYPLPATGRFRDFQLVLPTRLLLEYHIRRRLRAIDNVVIRDGHDVVGLVTQPGGRVSGAKVCDRADGTEQVMDADLVVDTTGRGSRTPAFLSTEGYGRPLEQEVTVRLTYSTLKLRLPPDALHELAVVIGAVPGRSTGMALLRNEADTWMFTAIGMVGVRPPDDLGGMTTFIEDFAPAHVVAAVREAQPLSEHAGYGVPSSRWRRYDNMRRFPSGLLVLGDAMCSFNPVYGQGMTVAAMEAEALHRCLTAGADGLTRRYFHAAAKIVGNAWQLAAGGDLALPEVEGPRPATVRFANRYVSNVQAAAASDLVVAQQLAHVVSFKSQPVSLFKPTVVARVAANRLRSKRSASLASPVTDPDQAIL